MLRAVISLLAFLGAAAVSAAETVEIGHLETGDDTGINWQFWTCDRAASTMHCHITQTFINHEVDPSQRDVALNNKLQQLPAQSFGQEMGDACTNVEQVRTFITGQLATGKKANGSALTRQEATDIRAQVDLMAVACKNSTPETVRAYMQQAVDQSTRTCVVTNISAEDTLRWNEIMKEWESRSPETGPCGAVTETRLHRDPTSKLGYWLLDERHLFVRPNGTLPDGRSCSIIPSDKTYHFTWRATQNTVDCTYLKNSMN